MFNKLRRKANHHRTLSKSTTSLTRIDNTITIDQHYPENSQSTLSLNRTSSNNIAIDDGSSLASTSFPDMDIYTEMDHVPPPRGRSHTITMGMKVAPQKESSPQANKRSRSLTQTKRPEDIYHRQDLSKTYSSPRHLFRRGALVECEIEDKLSSSSLGRRPVLRQYSSEDSGDQVTVMVEDDMCKVKDTAAIRNNQSLRDFLEFFFTKKSLSVEDLSQYQVTASRSGSPVPVDLDAPSYQYTSCNVEVRPRSWDKEGEDTSQLKFESMQDCLAYFNKHGLVELPNIPVDEDTYQLPRVDPIDPIESSWDELPIDPQTKESLSGKELDQQQVIWELIYTEHSYLQQLEVIINVFMRCLELVRRANLLSEDSYHNVFGYMEDIYNAHEKFWSWTLSPCLEKARETRQPLDLGEIITRFPVFSTQFEIYEQHCALESINLRSLNKAMKMTDFKTYLEWCESHPNCHRLKLKDLLIMPMQRLTKYPLLFTAILKETSDQRRESLENIWLEVSDFVQSVNMVLRAQEETERVRDAMSHIVGYTAVEIPNELKELIHPHTHLDLLAPMPDVEVDKSRVLMLEGNLKYRDNNTAKTVVHVFLFTDMLLITKPTKRGGDKYTIIKPPYKITSLLLHPSESGLVTVLVLNDYRMITSWFTLKANSEVVADEWMNQISAAQKFYTAAVEKKAQNSKLLESLRSERILNGIGQLDTLNIGALSQSLLSVGSQNGRRSLMGSCESILSIEGTSPPTTSQIIPLMRACSADTRNRLQSQPSVHQNGQIDLNASIPSWLLRASSLSALVQKPEMSATCKRDSESGAFPRLRSRSIDAMTSTKARFRALGGLRFSRSNSTISDVEDAADSSEEESDTIIEDLTAIEDTTLCGSTSADSPQTQAQESTQSPMHTQMLSPTSDEPKLKSILRTSSPPFNSNTNNAADGTTSSSNPESSMTDSSHMDLREATPTPMDSTDTTMHTLVPTGATNSSSDDSDRAISPSPNVEIVECIPVKKTDQFFVTPANHPHNEEPQKHLVPEIAVNSPTSTVPPPLQNMPVSTKNASPSPSPLSVLPNPVTDKPQELSPPQSPPSSSSEPLPAATDKPQELSPPQSPPSSSSEPLPAATDKPQELSPPQSPPSSSSEPLPAVTDKPEVLSSPQSPPSSSSEPLPAVTDKPEVLSPPQSPPSSSSEPLPAATDELGLPQSPPSSSPQKPASKHKVMFSDEAMTKSPQMIPTSRSAETMRSRTTRNRSPDRRLSLPNIDGSSSKKGEVQKKKTTTPKLRIPPAHKRITGKTVKQLSEMFDSPESSFSPPSARVPRRRTLDGSKCATGNITAAREERQLSKATRRTSRILPPRTKSEEKPPTRVGTSSKYQGKRSISRSHSQATERSQLAQDSKSVLPSPRSVSGKRCERTRSDVGPPPTIVPSTPLGTLKHKTTTTPSSSPSLRIKSNYPNQPRTTPLPAKGRRGRTPSSNRLVDGHFTCSVSDGGHKGDNFGFSYKSSSNNGGTGSTDCSRAYVATVTVVLKPEH